MRRRTWKQGIAVLMAVSLLGGCTSSGKQEDVKEYPVTEEEMERVEDTAASGAEETANPSSAAAQGGENPQENEKVFERPVLLKHREEAEADDITPCVEEYTIKSDLSNVDNLWQFYLNNDIKKKLRENGFVVCGSAGSEFFEIYETNRYMMYPNFITVDSLMHTYHLYFSELLKKMEKDYLADQIAQLSKKMLENSRAQYEQLKETEWENAARRNVAFFTIGSCLQEDDTEVIAEVGELVRHEMEKINLAEGISMSLITEEYEDYTQYIPRGYYEGDERLERYFKAMMWYGRTPFVQYKEDLDKSALLITKALTEDEEAYQLWESVYAVTSFFAGASDDLGVCEYAPVLYEAYGGNVSLEALAGNGEAFEKFHALTENLPAPQIHSIPIEEGSQNEIKSFRLMGQRFTMDAFVMQKLIYSNVKENSASEKRMLPDVLDVPAALGSDVALRILEEKGATDYKGYPENMEQLRKSLSQSDETLWSASLYAGWLNTLRPLLTVKGEGYPLFMQNEEWAKKNLECFAGSFAELKHDTILYSKQVIAEMGGGYEEEPDYRGYVEPEPSVYARFAALAEQTAEGLKKYRLLSAAEEENLTRLSQMARMLLTISKKELREELPTEEEFEFIEAYGGNLEHFWYEAVKDQSDSEWIDSKEFPAAIVADIATDPNGRVLEVATGNPSTIYVVVKVDGKLKIAMGSVYSFYQFEWPASDRLTDTKWRQMMGFEINEEGYYNYEDLPVERPEWTESYRYEHQYH